MGMRSLGLVGNFFDHGSCFRALLAAHSGSQILIAGRAPPGAFGGAGQCTETNMSITA
jgi:hypothetical protein